jgi:hypothetical protein
MLNNYPVLHAEFQSDLVLTYKMETVGYNWEVEILNLSIWNPAWRTILCSGDRHLFNHLILPSPISIKFSPNFRYHYLLYRAGNKQSPRKKCHLKCCYGKMANLFQNRVASLSAAISVSWVSGPWASCYRTVLELFQLVCNNLQMISLTVAVLTKQWKEVFISLISQKEFLKCTYSSAAVLKLLCSSLCLETLRYLWIGHVLLKPQSHHHGVVHSPAVP